MFLHEMVAEIPRRVQTLYYAGPCLFGRYIQSLRRQQIMTGAGKVIRGRTGAASWYQKAGVFCLALFAGPLFAGAGADRLNAFFAEKGAMSAEFVQTVRGAAFAQPEESSGTLLMQRPGKFRWDYRLPYEQQIIADGKRLWVYDVDLEQVIVKPLDTALGDTPALLLSGDGSVAQRFVINELSDRDDGLLWVELLPKQADTGFMAVRLGFDQKHLRSMELVDGFEQVTRLAFSKVKSGINLAADSFVFVPPKGVDVIGGEEGR